MATLTQHDAERLGKIVGLLDSPVEGESRAAIDRVKEFVRSRPAVFDDKPAIKPGERIRWPACGSVEYCEVLREWQRKYELLSVGRSSPHLTAVDVRLIKNLVRYKGLPRTIAEAARIDRLIKLLKERDDET